MTKLIISILFLILLTTLLALFRISFGYLLTLNRNFSYLCNMMTENPYIKQFPELMKDKTVLYCHGFGSSGQSGTVTRLRTVMPNARVIAPELPVDPHEAIALLHHICETEKPDLIIGTSMGGMYAEQLRGFDRICINPALEIAETMKAHGMTGTQQFQNPRQDGIQEFYVDNSQATHFHGEHRMDDKSYMHSVMPVIRWIDDKQEKRQRPIIYIGIETLMDQYQKPASSAQKAVRMLIEHYEVFFIAPLPSGGGRGEASWLEEYINVPAWQHTIFTPRRELLYGDYLIIGQKSKDKGQGEALATIIEYGSDTFKTWEDVIAYFSRLGGQ